MESLGETAADAAGPAGDEDGVAAQYSSNHSSAEPDRKFDLVGERDREIAIRRRADLLEILVAIIGIVRDDQGAGAEPAFNQVEDVRIERLRAVQQQQVDRLRQIVRQRLERVAFPELDQIGEACLGKIKPRRERPSRARTRW